MPKRLVGPLPHEPDQRRPPRRAGSPYPCGALEHLVRGAVEYIACPRYAQVSTSQGDPLARSRLYGGADRSDDIEMHSTAVHRDVGLD